MRFDMRLLFCGVAACLISSCTSVPMQVPIDPGAEFRASTEISSSRETAHSVVNNIGDVDLYCEHIGFRVIYDDPDSFLETGESVLARSRVFLRSGQTQVAHFSSDRGQHIRTATSLEPGHGCRAANFVDFCNNGVSSADEQSFMQWLAVRFRASDCSHLAAALQRRGVINLSGAPRPTLRPLIYLSSVMEYRNWPEGSDVALIQQLEQYRLKRNLLSTAGPGGVAD